MGKGRSVFGVGKRLSEVQRLGLWLGVTDGLDGLGLWFGFSIVSR